MRPTANSHDQARRAGFTLIELMAVVVTIGILAALLLPVLGKAKMKAQRTACLSNLHQLNLAWILYYNDNNGRLVESYPVNNTNAWVLGDMTRLSEATNLELLRQGKLFRYNTEVNLYRCPADPGVTISGTKVASVRSYSMNGFMGGREAGVGPIPPSAQNYVWCYSTDSEMGRPSQLWVMLDEDERSINDGFFVTDPQAQHWIDLPAMSARRHNFSFGLSFADGHSEAWHHRPARVSYSSALQSDADDSPDLQKLAAAATTRQ
jgi:prepilin-type N-terminal cleavage/methylation domain-containing protein